MTQTNAHEPILSARNTGIHFRVGKNQILKAVDGVSLDVLRGETFGIIGESGSGKTTLGRALICLERPTSGEIFHNSIDPFTLTQRELRGHRRQFQMIFQDPNAALNPRMKILSSVKEPLDTVGTLPDVRKTEIALEMMQRVGLSADFARRYPHELSGGQKQRVCIARVLTLNPALIVCDEAIAALDVSIQADVLNLLADLQKEFGLTYVFITHNLGVVSHISDRVAVMYLGRIVEMGATEEIMQRPLHPYTEALLSAEPQAVPPSMRSGTRIVLDGELPSPISPPSGCRFRTRCRFAQDVCAQKDPDWREVLPGRLVACHFAGELKLETEAQRLLRVPVASEGAIDV
jgi:oligopeptide/dipeptide ABC transporter ATP-binding protein